MTTATPHAPANLRASTLDSYVSRMVRLQHHLEHHLDDEVLDPEALARVACMSRAHFHRVFRAMFGVPIMEHVRRLRLERAALKLRHQSVSSLLELALDSGYGSHEAFTRAFQARFGLTPSDWRASPSARVTRAEPGPTAAAGAVVLREIPARRACVWRHWGDYLEISPVFGRAVEWGASRGLLGPEPELIGVYHDDPEITETERLRADVGFIHEGDLEFDGERRELHIPGGTYAIIVHVGPYDTLTDSYLDLIGRWLPTSGYELCAEGVVEVYLNDALATPPEQLRTEVQVRLQPA